MSPKIKPWLLLGGIFVIGVVTGAALTIGLGPHFARFMHPPVPAQHDMRKNWMAHLTKALNLSADQQAKIQPIVTDASTKLQALHHDEMEQGSQIFKTANDQISALLTPDQKAEMQKMEEERQKTFPGHMHPGGGFHHGGPDDQMPPPPAPPPASATSPAAPPAQ